MLPGWRRGIGALAIVSASVVLGAPAGALAFEARSLSGAGNNLAHPEWGEVGTNYVRLAPARYADGYGAMEEGPPPRYVSNRVFSSGGLDIFSERNVSQWGWVWGQFLDHTFGRAEPGTEEAPIPFDSSDPLERFQDTLGAMPFARSAVAPGTGTGPGNPREQVNTVNSFIDGWALYGGSAKRLEWMRTGPDDGNPAHEGASLLLPNRYLPTASARGSASTAPEMETEGALAENPQNAVVAGDVRANENAELTAVTTLFAREHNRIVAKLPKTLSEEERFQIARRVVGAEQQYVTYQEFLPAMGVSLSPYKGYDPGVDPELSDEFATVGYRAHSMVNGEEHIEVPAGKYEAKVEQLRALGVEVNPSTAHPSKLLLTVSQGAAFFDPGLVQVIGLGPVLEGLSEEPSYKNDEQIDDSLRSILFGIPRSGENYAYCYANPSAPECFSVVEDLGSIDIQRERDHGMPTYDQLREALGLPRQSTFREVTGESTEEFPTNDPLVPSSGAIEDPHILDFTSMENYWGEPVTEGGDSTARKRKEVPAASRLRDAAHDARVAPESDLRVGRKPRSPRRHDVGAARLGKRAGGTAVRDLAQAVRSAARRRPLLLRKRPGPGRNRIALRHQLQALAARTARARRQRGEGPPPGGRVLRADAAAKGRVLVAALARGVRFA